MGGFELIPRVCVDCAFDIINYSANLLPLVIQSRCASVSHVDTPFACSLHARDDRDAGCLGTQGPPASTWVPRVAWLGPRCLGVCTVLCVRVVTIPERGGGQLLSLTNDSNVGNIFQVVTFPLQRALLTNPTVVPWNRRGSAGLTGPPAGLSRSESKEAVKIWATYKAKWE